MLFIRNQLPEFALQGLFFIFLLRRENWQAVIASLNPSTKNPELLFFHNSDNQNATTAPPLFVYSCKILVSLILTLINQASPPSV